MPTSRRASESGILPSAPLPEPGDVLRLHDLKPGSLPEAHTILLGADLILLSDEANHCVRCFGRGGELLWSSTGGSDPAGRFNCPRGIALWEGCLWVCDALNHRIQILDPDGKPLGKIADRRAAAGGLAEPTDLQILAPGALLVADRRNHRGVVLDRDGEEIAAWGIRRQRIKRWESRPFSELVYHGAPLDRTIGGGLQFNYPNQFRLRDGLLWSADNEFLAVSGTLGQKLAEVPINPAVCFRGLAPLAEGAFFLDEATGGIAFCCLDGRLALLRAGAERLSGLAAEADSGRIAALQGDRLLFWSSESLRKAAMAALAGEDALTRRRSRMWRLKASLAVGRDEEANRHLRDLATGSLTPEAKEITLKLANRLPADSKLCRRTAEQALDSATEQLELAAACWERISGSTSLFPDDIGRTLPLSSALPKASACVNTSYLKPAAAEDVKRLYLLARQTSLDLAMARRLRSRPSKAHTRIATLLLPLTRSAVRLRAGALERVPPLLAEIKSSGPRPLLNPLAEANLLYALSEQLAGYCANQLELLIEYDLVDTGYSQLPPELADLLKEYNEDSPALFFRLAYGDRRFYRALSEEAELPREQSSAYAQAILDYFVALERFKQHAPRRHEDFCELAGRLWDCVLIPHRAASRHGVLLPQFLPRGAGRGADIVSSLDFEQLAAAVLAFEPTNRNASAERQTSEVLASLWASVRSFRRGRLKENDLLKRLASHCSSDASIARHAALGLWSLEDRELAISLLNRVLDQENESGCRDMTLPAALADAFREVSRRRSPVSDSDGERASTAPVSAAGNAAAAELSHLGLPGAAETMLRSYARVQRDPLFFSTFLLRALSRAGKEEEAESLWSRLSGGFDFGLHAEAGALASLGWKRQQEACARLAEQWRSNRPEGEPERERMLNLLIRIGGLPEAARVVDSLCSRHPERPELSVLAARLLIRMGKPEEALSLARRIRPRHLGEPVELEALLHDGQYDRALSMFTESRAEPERQAQRALSRARALLWAGDHEGALAELEGIHPSEKHDIDLRLLQCTQLMWQFRILEALEALDELAFVHPENAEVAETRALALLSLGRTAQLRRSLGAAAALGVASASLDGLLGACDTLDGEHARGRHLLRSALFREPDCQVANTLALQYARSLSDARPLQDDEQFIAALAGRYPALPAALYLRAVLIGRSEPAEALGSLPGRPLPVTPACALSALAAAQLSLALGDANRTRRLIEPFVNRFGIAEVTLLYARAAKQTGDDSAAARALEPLTRNLMENDRISRPVSELL